jgi:hypothetical protein
VLSKVLDSDFTRSINSLGDYILTIVKAIPKIEKSAEAAFCGFPFQSCHGTRPHESELTEEDYKIENIERIRREIARLKRRAKIINQEIKNHENLLEKIYQIRKELSRPIDIEDDFYS